jgi:chemotaxis protein CheZ
MAHHNLSLVQRLQDLSEADLKVPSPALASLIQDVVEELQNANIYNAHDLQKEFQEIAQYIQQARSEITSIGGQAAELDIPVATDELEAVVKATEEATGKILDAAEVIGRVAGELGEGANADALNDAATMIYEASNFQDVTGQRLTKVIKALQKIEGKIQSLSGGTPTQQADINNPASLLNGPQLPQNASSQDDIDALFDSL